MNFDGIRSSLSYTGFFIGLLVLGIVAEAAPVVPLERVPNEGIQPQAAVDSAGIVHLIYFKGNPAAGDIFYVHRTLGSKDFSAPLRVNTEPGSAMAVGTIRGAQLAVAH